MGRGELRASDADREGVAVALRDHYGAGRLSDDELSGRLDAAYRARTLADLDRLTGDLPVPAGAPGPTPRRHVTRGGRALRQSVRLHLMIYALVNLFLVGIWAASGGGYFWPIWSILGWGIGVAAHAAPALAGAGTRAYDPVRAASVREIAAEVEAERPDLRRAAAPDGTVTVMFSDIEGSTVLNERLGDVRWVELLRRHHAIVRAGVADHGGFEVKAQGDGFMIAFPSARRAVDCARAIQRDLADGLGDEVRVRIGLHTGEAIREENDFYGRNVVLAARIAAAADGGETLVSDIVRQLVASAGDLTFSAPRDLELQGLDGTYRVYAVS